MSKSHQRLLTPAELAKILPITERTLENWRLDGKGPPYVRLGSGAHNKVVYSWPAVEAWIGECTQKGDAQLKSEREARARQRQSRADFAGPA